MPSAAAVKILARGFAFQINTGTVGVPVWTPIKGINSFSDSWSKDDADATDFASAGWAQHVPAQRGHELSLEGFTLEDPADKARDAGQEAVELIAMAVGSSALDQFRMITPGGKIYQFDASASVEPFGGGNNDLSSWAATLTMSGVHTNPAS